MNIVLLIACILGFISVCFGAYNEHGLKKKVTEDVYKNVISSVRYNQIYSVLIACLGLVLYSDISPALENKLVIVSFIFTVAVTFFCLGIYLYALFDDRKFAKLAPFGGVLFMIGWIVLGWIAITITV